MKAKLNGEEVDVLPINGATLVALAGGLLEGVGVEKGEFPKEGKVYLLQLPAEECPELEEYHAEVSRMAHDAGWESVPTLDAIGAYDGLDAFGGRYQIVEVDRGEFMMKVQDVDRLGTDLEFDDDGRLVPHTVESVEEMRAHWQDFILPIPPPPKKSGDEVFLTLACEPYDQIKSGKKTTEFRDYTPSYVKKLLSHPIRTVKLQRGYGGPEQGGRARLHGHRDAA